ncbi:sensor histidine kinase [Streptomyces orinoci]|uniref:histidine kinase n=1 Tax=Streptomyces orinoci TaxID=67339 RepID=A0ABV3K781_STRON|nr:sensor histidine kinase [Streptomyces orinoci]
MQIGRTPALRTVIDMAMAVSLTAVAVSFARQYHPAGWPRFDTRAIALTGLANLPLALRRRTPWTALLCCAAGLTAYTAAGYQPSVSVWGTVLAFFSLAAVRPLRTSALAAVPALAAVEYSVVCARAVSVQVATAETLLVVGLAWTFGHTVRQSQERAVRLAELTRRLQVEQAARARHAVTEERMRIARELHDVVAHHLSVLSVQGSLASYVFDSDPRTARAALDTVTSTASQTLEEMRGLLQLLRISREDAQDAGTPGPDTSPGLDQLPELVERMTIAGLTVHTRTTGPSRPLPPGADLCAYRIVQEALTNVLKHAGQARVEISLDYSAESVLITVRDDGGEPGSTPEPVPGGGHGLIGMRERVTVYGGTFSAGPLEPAGYQVRFSLPNPRGNRDISAAPGEA